jgi:SAM-dependent methyltransferase
VESWRSTLEQVAKAAGLPFGPAIAPFVRALSDAYNEGKSHIDVEYKQSLSARLGFFFARDMSKAEAAVRELGFTRAIEGPLRILDLGAGLGAATFGVQRAVRAPVRATLVDRDEGALALARVIAKKRNVKIETVCADIASFSARDHDLVIAANVLTEIDATVEEDTERLLSWLGMASEEGSLVVIEPALKRRTRHLQEVRDRLARRGVAIFAPCLHARACPLLASPNDWCHEDLPIDLPGWLIPVARAAGLRWQGLTFSYLVLRRDGRTLASHLPHGSFRVVSSLIRTKGKMEARLCGTDRSGLAMRLDRDEAPGNEAFRELMRGDLMTMKPAVERQGRFRVDQSCKIERVSIDARSGRS